MDSIILNEKGTFHHKDQEIVERKGRGHPDTMSDQLAVELSRRYSKYTRENYGGILHHNFDKVGLLGGKSEVELGHGELTSPIRVLLNGRASDQFGDDRIPLREILVETTEDFLADRLPIDPQTDLNIQYNISTASSPGGVEGDFDEENQRHHWFKPRDLGDVRELTNPTANDTSHGTCHAPYSPAERLALQVEEHLTREYREENPWLGTDIKCMVVRDGDEVEMTAAIPQIASEVPDSETYDANLRAVEDEMERLAEGILPELDVEVFTNPETNYDRGEMYLTAIGSGIESGDEALVGRGNRVSGLITPMKPMSIEGQCGKNPVYHIGMIYNIAARRVSTRVHDETGNYTESHLVSQFGRDLTDPWKTVVDVYGDGIDRESTEAAILEELDNIPQITDDWLEGDVRLV